MHSLAERIAKWLVDKSDYPYKQEEIRYGTEVFLGIILQICIISIIAFAFGLLKETAFLFFSAAVYRIYSGGVHCEKYYRCTITSLAIFLSLAYLIRYLLAIRFLLVFFLVLIISVGVTICLVPVYNPKNPVIEEEKKERLKYKTIFILLTLIIIALSAAYVLQDLSMAYAILLGLLWQSFTLTAWGQKFVSDLDRIFTYIEKVSTRKEG